MELACSHIFTAYRLLQQEIQYGVAKTNSKNKQIQSMLEYMREFLDEYCKHEMETDWVDINIETTQKIVFCKKCEFMIN
jgi:hypothetical protein